MMSENTKVHLIKQLDVTDLSGEKVMIDFSTGKYFLLKGSANDIWDMLSNDITVSEIKNSLMEIYDKLSLTALKRKADKFWYNWSLKDEIRGGKGYICCYLFNEGDVDQRYI